MRMAWLWSVCLFVAVGGCRSVYTEFDHRVDFSSYRTYAWIPDGDGDGAGDARGLPRLPAFMRDEMGAALETRGFRSASPGEADVLACLRVEAGLYASVEPDGEALDEPRRNTGGFSLASLSDSWMPEQEKTMATDQGTLVLTLRDRRTDVLIWQGWVQRAIDMDALFEFEAEPETPGREGLFRRRKQALLKAVAALAEKLPDRSGR